MIPKFSHQGLAFIEQKSLVLLLVQSVWNKEQHVKNAIF